MGEAHTQGKSRVSHRPLRQGRHAGRCGAAGTRTVRARAVVACASVQECPPSRQPALLAFCGTGLSPVLGGPGLKSPVIDCDDDYGSADEATSSIEVRQIDAH